VFANPRLLVYQLSSLVAAVREPERATVHEGARHVATDPVDDGGASSRVARAVGEPT
jgi:hypothetical protein